MKRKIIDIEAIKGGKKLSQKVQNWKSTAAALYKASSYFSVGGDTEKNNKAIDEP